VIITIQLCQTGYRCRWMSEYGQEGATFDTLRQAISNCTYFVKNRGYTLIFMYYPIDKA